jgi:hypothetical protein
VRNFRIYFSIPLCLLPESSAWNLWKFFFHLCSNPDISQKHCDLVESCSLPSQVGT